MVNIRALGFGALLSAAIVTTAGEAAAQGPAGSASHPAKSERLEFLEQGVFVMYHTLNSGPSQSALPPELLLYDDVILEQYGEPLDLGRVVQLMLYVDQTAIHSEGRRGLDGLLIEHKDDRKHYVGRSELERVGRLLGKSPPLDEVQLAAMTQALYGRRADGQVLRQFLDQYPEMPVAAAALLFVDRSDGTLDGQLLADGQLELARIFQHYGTQPVIPFAAKRGPGSWVTAREFIRPQAVSALLDDLKPQGRKRESKLVKQLLGQVARRLAPQPDRDERQAACDYWAYPEETLRKGGGDCEDISFVLQSCLEALQVRSRLTFGQVWDPAAGRWQGHVWVEWDGKVLDLAYRTSTQGINSFRNRKNSPYRGLLWFDSQRIGLTEDWKQTLTEPQRQGPARISLAAAFPANRLWSGRNTWEPAAGLPRALASRSKD